MTVVKISVPSGAELRYLYANMFRQFVKNQLDGVYGTLQARAAACACTCRGTCSEHAICIYPDTFHTRVVPRRI